MTRAASSSACRSNINVYSQCDSIIIRDAKMTCGHSGLRRRAAVQSVIYSSYCIQILYDPKQHSCEAKYIAPEGMETSWRQHQPKV